MSLDTFEQSLLTELRQHVASRSAARAAGWRRPAARRVAGAGLVGAAAVTALALSIGVGTGALAPAPAFAVQRQPDGDVVVTVRDLSDPAGLERALAAQGVRATVSYVPAFAQRAGATRTTTNGAGCDIVLAKVRDGLRFTLAATQVDHDAPLSIITSGSSASDVGSPVAVTWSGGSC